MNRPTSHLVIIEGHKADGTPVRKEWRLKLVDIELRAQARKYSISGSFAVTRITSYFNRQDIETSELTP